MSTELKHTPEPWAHVPHQTENKALIQSGDGRHLAELWTLDKTVNCSANAKRIVECVNAFAGIHNPMNVTELTKAIVDLYKAEKELRIQRDELLSALEVCWNSLRTYGSHPIIEKQVNAAINLATKPTQP